MAVFRRLFAELFRLKSKKAYAMLLVQLVGVPVIGILSFDNMGNHMTGFRHVYIGSIDLTYFFSGLLAFYFVFAMLFCFIFYLLTCTDNERINRSQTMRLTPLSDAGFYLANILSSLVTFVYYVLLNVLVMAVLFGINLAVNSSYRTGIPDMINSITHYGIPSAAVFNFMALLLLVLLTGLFGYFLLSLINFSSQSILDFLPGVSSKTVLNAVRLILIIFMAWLFLRAENIIMHILVSPFEFLLGSNSGVDLGLSNAIMLTIDLVFLAASVFLFSRFFEGRAKN